MTEWQYQVRFDVKDAATAESVRHGQPDPALAPLSVTSSASPPVPAPITRHAIGAITVL
jgi:hypothetical protein